MTDQTPQDVISLAQKFAKALERKDMAAITRLVNAYQDMYADIVPRIELLLIKIEAAGGQITKAQLLRLAQYKDLIDTIQRELDQFSTYLKVELRQIANASILNGSKDAQLLLEQILADAGVVNVRFNSVNPDVIRQLLGFLDPQGSLYKTLESYGEFTARNVAETIITSIAQGNNPKVLAKLIEEALGRSLTAAMRTARTVQLWAYREASRQNYIANKNVVKGWIWKASLDELTCEACIVLDGTMHELSEPLDGHYNCRCTPIPVTILNPNPDRRTGIDWFNSLPEARQRKILGPGKFDAWKAGKFELSQLAKQVENEDYGSMRVEAALKDLVGEGD
jgi:SPP1 gp7 family putative phage head morphogenesis protein